MQQLGGGRQRQGGGQQGCEGLQLWRLQGFRQEPRSHVAAAHMATEAACQRLATSCLCVSRSRMRRSSCLSASNGSSSREASRSQQGGQVECWYL